MTCQLFGALGLLQVLHLDVAPSNIIVDKDGKGVLVDFHMAKHGVNGQVVMGHVTRRCFMSLSRLTGGPATLSGKARCSCMCFVGGVHLDVSSM